MAIESSSIASRLYRSYRKLPDFVRAPARWLVMPRWHIVTTMVRVAARGAVVSGPFQGMRMDLSPVSSRHLLGYILGTQELELHGVVERIVTRDYKTIVNVGAADGYYAVGLARRLPKARIVGFEGLAELHPVLRHSAELNGVADRFTINGFCEPPDLKRALGASEGRTLLISDIEGGEIDLLDPARARELDITDILVETHDAFVPGCTETLIDRFSATHNIERITARPRTLKDFPKNILPWLPRRMPDLAVELMNERRTGLQQWLYMEAKRQGR
ncbi:hypothetical protein N825_21820 [Skermanella stibiiresistens SB22]|uniref:Methyltransferase FkbM domain-containing protein n=2 Tax=Skermanella TaxID=204447 RepID=W9GXA2_9PROT|nr:hypothetical protein N825_21820 [Skermanella stibiiresistens SB22]